MLEYPVFAGMSLVGNNIEVVDNVDTVEKCSQFCSRTTLCEEWSYISNDETCELLSGRQGPVENAGAVSGISMIGMSINFYLWY